MINRIFARGGLVALATVLLVAAPKDAEAQDASKVYTLAEVTTPPKVKSENAAANAINRSYPDGLRAVGGRVQLRFVVRPDGKVDASTIEVIAASATQLGEAAAKAVQQIDFQPAEFNGVAVNTMVIFPITFAAR
jgi:TonB family protein